MKDRVKVATSQYFLRPIKKLRDFEEQVDSICATSADYGAKLLVLPEYFTIQLLCLEDPKTSSRELLKKLSLQFEYVSNFLGNCSKKYGLYLVGGSTPRLDKDGQIRNIAVFSNPKGELKEQGKIHLTRFEDEEWKFASSSGITVFDTDLGKILISICYDVEFPELVRYGANLGVDILVVPSWTDTKRGFQRVRYCAQARAIENQIYVIQSPVVGSLPQFPFAMLNYGCASVLTPCDVYMARDGILAEGEVNQETLVFADLELELLKVLRENGTVRTLLDSKSTQRKLEESKKIKF